MVQSFREQLVSSSSDAQQLEENFGKLASTESHCRCLMLFTRAESRHYRPVVHRSHQGYLRSCVVMAAAYTSVNGPRMLICV